MTFEFLQCVLYDWAGISSQKISAGRKLHYNFESYLHEKKIKFTEFHNDIFLNICSREYLGEKTNKQKKKNTNRATIKTSFTPVSDY